jgi:hypothetical protein
MAFRACYTGDKKDRGKPHHHWCIVGFVFRVDATAGDSVSQQVTVVLTRTKSPKVCRRRGQRLLRAYAAQDSVVYTLAFGLTDTFVGTFSDPEG